MAETLVKLLVMVAAWVSTALLCGVGKAWVVGVGGGVGRHPVGS